MRVILKPGILAIVPETEGEQAAFETWRDANLGHVFEFSARTADGGSLHDLGPREDACREPINVVFDQVGPDLQPISNLAFTPFNLHGRDYASVEGFWQGLTFSAKTDRTRLAKLWGIDAKRAAHGGSGDDHFVYEGKTYMRAGPEHRALMFEACRAKFSQHLGAREALLATGDRPLIHRVRRDSTTVPGALMADYWRRIRTSLRDAQPLDAV